MGRKVAIAWHASFSIAAGALYFYFVLPRWHELTGDTSHALGTALRIVAGALIGLAALPVVFTLLRTRKPELGTPALALSIRTWSIVAHVLAGVLIIGTATSEIWLSLDAAGQWLFGIYGAAAAIAVLGFFAFYLSFVAELPPPPPKPIKAGKPRRPRKPGKRSVRRKKGTESDQETDGESDQETDEAEDSDADAEPGETETAEQPLQPVEAAAESHEEAGPESAAGEAEATDEPRAALRNRRPTGKVSHRTRRRRTHGGVAVDE